MKNKFQKQGEVQGFQFSFGISRIGPAPQAFIELDDAFDARLSLEARDTSVEGLGAKIEQALKARGVPKNDRQIVQSQIFDDIVTPALRGRL